MNANSKEDFTFGVVANRLVVLKREDQGSEKGMGNESTFRNQYTFTRRLKTDRRVRCGPPHRPALTAGSPSADMRALGIAAAMAGAGDIQGAQILAAESEHGRAAQRQLHFTQQLARGRKAQQARALKHGGAAHRIDCYDVTRPAAPFQTSARPAIFKRQDARFWRPSDGAAIDSEVAYGAHV